MTTIRTALALAALLPFAAHAGERSDLGRDLDQARTELRAELARERSRLETENLSLGGTLRFGRTAERASTTAPRGEITPAGDLIVDGKAVAVDAAQRARLLAYRRQVIDVARAGVDAGEKAALAALEATDVSLLRLIVGGMSGSLERRVESVVQREVRPAVLRICRQLPALRGSQQALAAELPAFRPFATLREDGVARCESDLQRDLAAR